MPRHTVTSPFWDLEARVYRKPGETLTLTEQRAARLVQAGCVDPRPVPEALPPAPAAADPAPPPAAPAPPAPDPQPQPEPEIKHVGGGFWELPDGRRIRGKEAALAALAEPGGD